MTTRSAFPSTPSSPGSLGRSLDELAWSIAADGIEHHEAAVAHAVAWLRTAGRTGALLELVADLTQPAVARERAFGRIAHDRAAPAARPAPDPRLVAA